MLNAIALETVNSPVVHAHRQDNGQCPFGILDHSSHIIVELERIGREVKVLQRGVVGVLLDYSRDWHIVRLLFFT
jgi:hypothetical protein